MSTQFVPPEHSHPAPELPNHTLGIIDSPAECEKMIASLQSAGIARDAIRTFQGSRGDAAFTELLQGYQWGESGEKWLEQGAEELSQGHVIVCVRVKDDNEAKLVAEISNQHGGRDVTHFGTLVDIRLT